MEFSYRHTKAVCLLSSYAHLIELFLIALPHQVTVRRFFLRGPISKLVPVFSSPRHSGQLLSKQTSWKVSMKMKVDISVFLYIY